MRKLVLSILGFLLITLQVHAQYEWANSGGGSMNEPIKAVAVDSQGNVYAAGNYEEPVTVQSNGTATPINASGSDGFYIWKTDALGNLEWIIPVTGYGIVAEALSISPNDELYVAGTFVSSLSVGGFSEVAFASSDCFLMKLNADGVVLRLGAFGGDYLDQVTDVKCDVNSDIFLVGRTYEPIDLSPGPEVLSFPLGGSYVMKMTKEWDVVWCKFLVLDGLTKIDIDYNHNVYVVGHFDGTRDFDPSSGVYELTSTSNWDAFLLSLDNNGTFRWVRTLGGDVPSTWQSSASYDVGRSVATDKVGSVYFVGQTRGDVTAQTVNGSVTNIGYGSNDFFIQKYDTAGALLWHQLYGGEEMDNCQDVVADTLGRVFLTGYFQGTADFDFGSGTEIHTSTSMNVYFLQLLGDGSLLSFSTVGGICTSYGTDLAFGPSNELYAVGCFSGTVEFGQSSVPNIISNGNIDGMVVKLGASAQLDNLSASDELLISPNPLYDSFKVHSNNKIESITIVDALGKVMLVEENTQELINVGHLSAGTYVLMAKGQDGSISYQKLIKK